MLNLQHPKTKWLFLLVGSISVLLCGPVFQIGIAGWIVPIGLLYFTRESKVFKGYLWSVLYMSVFLFISGLFSSALPPSAVIVTAALSGVLEMIPYLLDRIFYRRLNPKYAFLFFPVIAVSYEYLVSFPLSSIGALAASQTGFTELNQLASITGVWGISFMMYWLASAVVPYLLKEKYRPSLKHYGLALSIILVFGMIKLRVVNPLQETVKVSGIVVEEFELFEDIYEDFFGEKVQFGPSAGSSPQMQRLFEAIIDFQKNPSDPRFSDSMRALENFEDKIIEITKQEARNGAKIIVWSETNLSIFQHHEERAIRKAQNVARQENAYILTSMAVLLPYVEGGPQYENKSLLITPQGEIVDTYEKAYPVPFMDASLPGDGILDIIETEYGALTTAICYDADFPELITQSGSADILLVPANDWLGVSPYHGDYSLYRGIENGVSIVRPTGTGQSVIFDPHGNALARLDAYDKNIRVINAHVPVKGVTTIFNYIGNSFAWLCILISVALIGVSIISPHKTKILLE